MSRVARAPAAAATTGATTERFNRPSDFASSLSARRFAVFAIFALAKTVSKCPARMDAAYRRRRRRTGRISSVISLHALHAIAIFRNAHRAKCRRFASRSTRISAVRRRHARATTANRCASARSLCSRRRIFHAAKARHRRVNARTRNVHARASCIRSKTFLAATWRHLCVALRLAFPSRVASARAVATRRASRRASAPDTHRSNHARKMNRRVSGAAARIVARRLVSCSDRHARHRREASASARRLANLLARISSSRVSATLRLHARHAERARHAAAHRAMDCTAGSIASRSSAVRPLHAATILASF